MNKKGEETMEFQVDVPQQLFFFSVLFSPSYVVWSLVGRGRVETKMQGLGHIWLLQWPPH